jgi:hypothetical protein
MNFIFITGGGWGSAKSDLFGVPIYCGAEGK